MKLYENQTPEQTGKLLRESFEVCFYRRLALAVLLILAVIIGIWMLDSREQYAFWDLLRRGGTMILLWFAPMLIFLLYRIIPMFIHLENYSFYRVKLENPHSSFHVRAMYFTIPLEMENGTTLVVDTHSFFALRSLVFPTVEDHVNQMVTIAYNKVTGKVVVVG